MNRPATIAALDELLAQLHYAATAGGNAPLDDEAEDVLVEQFTAIGRLVTDIDPAAANYVLTTAIEKIISDILEGKLPREDANPLDQILTRVEGKLDAELARSNQ